MIDIHSHLIFGVDDGASCLEESMKMLDAARKQGIDTIIATPHFHNGVFKNDSVIERYELLAERASCYGTDIRLGNEVFVYDDMFSFIKPVNTFGTQYMLTSLPYSATFDYAEKLLSRISSLNINMIIAHPERNRKVMKHFGAFMNLVHTLNCHIQIDAGSIVGIYGSSVREAARQMLILKRVHYMASNAHSAEDYQTLFPGAVQRLYRLCREDYVHMLLESRAPQIMTVNGGVTYGRETG